MNAREHFSARARRVKKERKVVWGEWHSQVKQLPKFDQPIVIRFTRISSRKMDSDNLASAFKGVRDQVAQELKVNDGDERITWLYQQEKGSKHLVRIEIYRNPSGKQWKEDKGR